MIKPDEILLRRRLHNIATGKHDVQTIFEEITLLAEAGRATPGEKALACLMGTLSNSTRNFFRRCPSSYTELELHFLPIRLLKAPSSDEIEYVNMPVFRIRDILGQLFRKGGSAFPHAMWNDVQDPKRLILKFWDRVDGLSAVAPRHPVNSDPQFAEVRDLMLPLSFHSDGGEVWAEGKITVFSFSSTLWMGFQGKTKLRHSSIY